LEFELRFQQYIELVRSDSDPRTYISYAKKYLIPQKQNFPVEVQAACGMLAFLDPSRSGYNGYFSQERWDILANLFVEAHNTLLGLPPIPLLHIALNSGLPALKTPACKPCVHDDFLPSENRPMPSALGSSQQSVCPICSMELDALSRNVPYAHHVKSHVANDLVLLPSMHVYSRAQLLDSARKAGLPPHLVRDLRTGQTHDISTLKKVFMT
jgi:macrophage erythroblast attacher